MKQSEGQKIKSPHTGQELKDNTYKTENGGLLKNSISATHSKTS